MPEIRTKPVYVLTLDEIEASVLLAALEALIIEDEDFDENEEAGRQFEDAIIGIRDSLTRARVNPPVYIPKFTLFQDDEND
jgi:stalled ribosome rescue protein Dom34